MSSIREQAIKASAGFGHSVEYWEDNINTQLKAFIKPAKEAKKAAKAMGIEKRC